MTNPYDATKSNQNIQTDVFPVTYPSMSLTWTPQGKNVSYVIDANEFLTSTKTIRAKVATFFSATVTMHGYQQKVLNYEWRFSDDHILYGKDVVRNFQYDIPELSVTLIVHDNKGNRFSKSARLIFESRLDRYGADPTGADEFIVPGNVLLLDYPDEISLLL